jgi:type IV pilus assembly protein PilB
MDIGIEPYLISSSVAGVLAQRLVRTICPKCKGQYQPEEGILKTLGIENTNDLTFYRGKGCKNCWQTGYKGRIALFELLLVDEPMRDLISQRAPSKMIRESAKETFGMKSLREDGIDKVLKGIATIDEVNKVSFEYKMGTTGEPS